MEVEKISFFLQVKCWRKREIGKSKEGICTLTNLSIKASRVVEI